MFKRETRFCRDCDHLSKNGFNLCISPHNGVSAVTGEIQPTLAVAQRSDFRRVNGLSDTGCGPEGKYFTPIIVPPPKQSLLHKILQLFKVF